LQPAGIAASATHLSLAPVGDRNAKRAKPAPTSVALFDQGLVQVLQAAVTGRNRSSRTCLRCRRVQIGSGALEPLAEFVTNPAGAAIVNALGPIRRVVQEPTATARRFLVIVPGTSSSSGSGPDSGPAELKDNAPDGRQRAFRSYDGILPPRRSALLPRGHTRAQLEFLQHRPPGPHDPRTLRAYDEDWSFLRNPSRRTDFFDPIKWIPLDKDGSLFLTVWWRIAGALSRRT